MQFSCPGCGHTLEAPEGVFAKEGKCKFCGALIVSPSAIGASATLKQQAPPGPSSQASSAPPPSSGAYVPPPSGGYTPPSGGYDPTPPYAGQFGYQPYQPAPSRSSGFALASVILGVLGLVSCGLSAIPGLICGVIALAQTGPNSERYGGRTMAIVGTVMSSIFIILLPAAILFPVFAKARDTAQKTMCINNIKQAAIGLQAYTMDYGEHLPPAVTWDRAVTKYMRPPVNLSCPKVSNGSAKYKMSVAVGSAQTGSFSNPSAAIVLFDARPGGARYGGPRDVRAEHYARAGQTDKAATFSFGDGHVQVLPPTVLPQSSWRPK